MQPPHRRRLLSRKKVYHTKSGFSVRSFSSDKSFLTQLTCIKILDIPENNWLHHEREHEATILKSAMDISDKNPYGNGLLYAGFNQVRKEETSDLFWSLYLAQVSYSHVTFSGPDVFLCWHRDWLQNLQQWPSALPGEPGERTWGRGQVRRDALQVITSLIWTWAWQLSSEIISSLVFLYRFRCNYIALVGGGPSPRCPGNKVTMTQKVRKSSLTVSCVNCRWQFGTISRRE